MEFTYGSYIDLLNKLKDKGYGFCRYNNWESDKKQVILRHDIDFDIEKSVRLARIEAEQGVTSVYFVLLSTDFYNVFSKRSQEMLEEIVSLGHEVGLHFDEVKYSAGKEDYSPDDVIKDILYEREVLSKAVGHDINSVSFHRPSKKILDANVNIPGMINSYSSEFFSDFKYLSDSRRNWREPVIDIVESGMYDKLHILTHAFWYNEEEKDLKTSLKELICDGTVERYKACKDNFKDLESVIVLEDLK